MNEEMNVFDKLDKIEEIIAFGLLRFESIDPRFKRSPLLGQNIVICSPRFSLNNESVEDLRPVFESRTEWMNVPFSYFTNEMSVDEFWMVFRASPWYDKFR